MAVHKRLMNDQIKYMIMAVYIIIKTFAKDVY